MNFVTEMGQDEYTVLTAFLCGILCHSFLLLRSLRGIGTVLLLILACAAAVILIPILAGESSEVPTELASLMAGTAMLYAIVFSLVYRARLMPVLNADILAHYTILMYYGLGLSVRDAGVTLPVSILVAGSLPFLFALVMIFWAHRAGETLKKFSYGWFLIMLLILAGIELGLMAEHGPKRFEASLYESAVWFFLLGPFFMYIVSLVIYILLMLPSTTERKDWFHWGLTGEHRTIREFDVDMREEAADRTYTSTVTPLGILLLLAHTILLGANYRYGFVAHGVLLSSSIVLLIQIASFQRKGPLT